MKVKVIIYVFSAVLLTKTSCGKDPQKQIVNMFIEDVSNDQKSMENIVNKYFCSLSESPNDQNGTKISELVIEYLLVLRQQVFEHQQWDVVRYLDLKDKEHIIQIDEKEKANIYVLKFSGENIPPCYIWIRNDKIVSFITLHKGGDLYYFLEFCS